MYILALQIFKRLCNKVFNGLNFDIARYKVFSLVTTMQRLISMISQK